jgi:hypothetical protein
MDAKPLWIKASEPSGWIAHTLKYDQLVHDQHNFHTETRKRVVSVTDVEQYVIKKKRRQISCMTKEFITL